MTRTRTPQELRDRMERVAAKRRQPPKSAPKRSTVPDTEDLDVSVSSIGPAGAASGRRSGSGVGRASHHQVTAHRSRLATLVAWGMWEFVTVPARRLRWLREVISADDSRTDDPGRGN